MAEKHTRVKVHKHRWLGSQLPHLDRPAIVVCGNVVIGCYGGNTSAGAHKNEDAALVWCAQNPRNLYKDFTFWDHDLEASVRMALGRVHREKGADSATVIAWRTVSPEPGTQASSPAID